MGEGAALLALVTAQRLIELVIAHRNTKRLLAAGGIEFGRAHYPVMVVLHGCWLAGLWLVGRDRAVEPLMLAVFVVLQAVRAWVIMSLGRRWTTRVIVVPAETPIAAGPYRWVRHPNYLVVAAEIVVMPFALGLPLYGGAFGVFNAVLLVHRVRIEEEALAWAARQEVPTLPIPDGGDS